ncbi:CD3324 family protein [Gracilibacillus sp. JCM 18860]|uniref:CD3324 family protein n=1 Tax=Gracilibacillus sp. JCM 18860 TaxID=1306159 RepID=UPI0006D13C22
MKAHEILPKELLDAIQEYIQGETIYIPKRANSYQKWGGICSGGSRQYLDKRNQEIRKAFRSGKSMEELARVYHLSTESIKKIIYAKKKEKLL